MDYKVKIQCRAFSLAEAMLAMVILAAAASSILLPFASGAAVRAEGARRTLAAKLASDLMEQFVCTSFDELKDDCGGYVDEQQGDIEDASETKFTELATGSIYANFSRSATCEDVPGQSFLILATVTVKYNENELVRLSRLISK